MFKVFPVFYSILIQWFLNLLIIILSSFFNFLIRLRILLFFRLSLVVLSLIYILIRHLFIINFFLIIRLSLHSLLLFSLILLYSLFLDLLGFAFLLSILFCFFLGVLHFLLGLLYLVLNILFLRSFFLLYDLCFVDFDLGRALLAHFVAPSQGVKGSILFLDSSIKYLHGEKKEFLFFLVVKELVFLIYFL